MCLNINKQIKKLHTSATLVSSFELCGLVFKSILNAWNASKLSRSVEVCSLYLPGYLLTSNTWRDWRGAVLVDNVRSLVGFSTELNWYIIHVSTYYLRRYIIVFLYTPKVNRHVVIRCACATELVTNIELITITYVSICLCIQQPANWMFSSRVICFYSLNNYYLPRYIFW